MHDFILIQLPLFILTKHKACSVGEPLVALKTLVYDSIKTLPRSQSSPPLTLTVFTSYHPALAAWASYQPALSAWALIKQYVLSSL